MDYHSESAKKEAESYISLYSLMCDEEITLSRDGVSRYELLPAQRELEVAGVKQDW